MVAGVPFFYIISISQDNVKWILARRGIRSQWAWTNDAYSVLSQLENRMEQEETEPGNYPVCIAASVPFVVE